jgi:hypothetical protein
LLIMVSSIPRLAVQALSVCLVLPATTFALPEPNVQPAVVEEARAAEPLIAMDITQELNEARDATIDDEK